MESCFFLHFRRFCPVTEDYADAACGRQTENLVIVPGIATLRQPSQKSSDAIRDVYAGKVNNWREVGSQYSGKIVAFVSEKGMGDREIFDKSVMKGGQIGLYNNGATIRETHSLYSTFLDMQRLSPKAEGYGIAFSSLYYYETLVESRNFRALNVDGMTASKKRLKDGTYPYITNVFVMVRDERDTGTNARRLYDFMTSEAGQEIVEESGYIGV